jgi:hypothetical protein
MNKITRRLRELSTGMVKERRLSQYPYDINLKQRNKKYISFHKRDGVSFFLRKMGLTFKEAMKKGYLRRV